MAYFWTNEEEQDWNRGFSFGNEWALFTKSEAGMTWYVWNIFPQVATNVKQVIITALLGWSRIKHKERNKQRLQINARVT